jgi:hypothetical protein
MTKMIKEKKTGEMYSSKSAKKMHEKGETMKEKIKEYGITAVKKKMAKKKK